MGRYLIRRALFMVLVIIIVSLLTFLIFVKLPAGDPARRAVGRTTTPEQIENARVAFGLDKPLYVQYWRFLKGFIPWPVSIRCSCSVATPRERMASGSTRTSTTPTTASSR